MPPKQHRHFGELKIQNTLKLMMQDPGVVGVESEMSR